MSKQLSKEKLMQIPIIDLDDLLLRPVSVDDAEDMFEYGSDDEVTKHLAWNSYTKMEDTINSIQNVFLTRPEKGIPYAYAIVHKEDQKMIGTCDFFSVNWEKSRGEIGYVMNKNYWGKGYMTRVCQALIRFGFEYLGITSIDIRHHKENIGSARVIEKCGFTYIEDSYHKAMNIFLPTYVLHKEDVYIRPATYYDAPQKGYVHYQSWQETYTGLINQEFLDARTEEVCVDIARKHYDKTYLAITGGNVVGFVSCDVTRDQELLHTGEIFAIYVLQKYQGRSIGKKLLDYAMQKLKQYENISIWVLEGNTIAINFYKHMGFVEDGAKKKETLRFNTVLDVMRMITKNPYYK